jgi:hypothetical protein
MLPAEGPARMGVPGRRCWRDPRRRMAGTRSKAAEGPKERKDDLRLRPHRADASSTSRRRRGGVARPRACWRRSWPSLLHPGRSRGIRDVGGEIALAVDELGVARMLDVATVAVMAVAPDAEHDMVRPFGEAAVLVKISARVERGGAIMQLVPDRPAHAVGGRAADRVADAFQPLPDVLARQDPDRAHGCSRPQREAGGKVMSASTLLFLGSRVTPMWRSRSIPSTTRCVPSGRRPCRSK